MIYTPPRTCIIVVFYMTILLFPIHSLNSQQNIDDKYHTSNKLTTLFNKGFEIDSWTAELSLNSIRPGKSEFYFREDISALLYSTSGFHRHWKVDQNLNFRFDRTVNRRFGWLLSGEQELFYNQRAYRYIDDINPTAVFPNITTYHGIAGQSTVSSRSDIETNHLAAGVKYKFGTNLNSFCSVGPMSDKRRGDRNEGIKMKAGLKNSWNNGSVWFDGWIDRLPVGTYHGVTAELDSEHQLAEGASDAYSISYQNNRQRGFNPLGNVEVPRSDERLRISNQLSSKAEVPLQIAWDSQLSRQKTFQRSLHQDIQSNYSDDFKSGNGSGFNWKNDLITSYKTSNFNASVIGGIDLQEQNYYDALTQGTRNYLGTISEVSCDLLDSLSFEARVIKYRFDTPDENDLNDRDELRYILILNSRKQLTPALGLRLRLETDLHHLVYIYRPRSSENRWTRLFILSCGVPWSEDRIKNIAKYSVSSSYTVYDYGPVDSELSRVFRFYSIVDTLNIRVLNNIDLEMSLEYIIEDHGKFRWSDWVEDVSEEGYTVSSSIIPTYRITDMNLGFGWRFQQRFTWVYRKGGEKFRGEAVRSDGPILFLSARPADRITAEVTGQMLRVDDNFRGTYNLPDIRCRLTWTL